MFPETSILFYEKVDKLQSSKADKLYSKCPGCYRASPKKTSTSGSIAVCSVAPNCTRRGHFQVNVIEHFRPNNIDFTIWRSKRWNTHWKDFALSLSKVSNASTTTLRACCNKSRAKGTYNLFFHGLKERLGPSTWHMAVSAVKPWPWYTFLTNEAWTPQLSLGCHKCRVFGPNCTHISSCRCKSVPCRSTKDSKHLMAKPICHPKRNPHHAFVYPVQSTDRRAHESYAQDFPIDALVSAEAHGVARQVPPTLGERALSTPYLYGLHWVCAAWFNCRARAISLRSSLKMAHRREHNKRDKRPRHRVQAIQ